MTKKVERFDEIEARRIRIVDEDGTVRIVLTVPPLPEEAYRGTPMAQRNAEEAGLLFYNDEGVECGGLTFHGKSVEGKPDAGMTLAFNQYDSEQVLLLQYTQVDQKRAYGLSIADPPLTPVSELPEGHSQRLFVGRTDTGEVCLYLMDSRGRPRVRVAVDADDNPKMEFMDSDGKVTYAVPPQST